ncbi:gamma carbonic anhydrase family protein [Haloferax namakaokahaiae]|uniref:Gamma carbonic anhydrase family protein n=1 Tax=Haloferax namakaokahaiae TaxID=1748331 RepID=A0ABD5ZDJ0_9EURY
MQYPFDGNEPKIAESAFVADLTYLVGDVDVGARASLWPFVCLRGDRGAVTVGADTNVQEFTMLHGATVGDGVSIGHGAVVDFATIEDEALVGIGSCVLGGATVESHSIVAAHAVVTHDQTVPSGHLAYGVPAKTRPLTDDQLVKIADTRDHYVELSREFVHQDTGFDEE